MQVRRAQRALARPLADAPPERDDDVLEESGRGERDHRAPERRVERHAIETLDRIERGIEMVRGRRGVVGGGGRRGARPARGIGLGARRAPVGVERGERGVRERGDLADRAAGEGGAGEQAKPLDVGVGVQAPAAPGADGRDDVVAPFPGADDVDAEAGAARDHLDRVRRGGQRGARRHAHSLGGVMHIVKNLSWTFS